VRHHCPFHELPAVSLHIDNDFETTAADEIQSCAGARSARASLPHLWNSASASAAEGAGIHASHERCGAGRHWDGRVRPVVCDGTRRITSDTAGALEPDRVPCASSERRQCQVSTKPIVIRAFREASKPAPFVAERKSRPALLLVVLSEVCPELEVLFE
jgi:hypothetical protein